MQSTVQAVASQQFVLDAVAPAAVDPATVPIKHVIIIVKENHTFDNYFGSFPGVDGTLQADGSNQCDLPTGRATSWKMC